MRTIITIITLHIMNPRDTVEKYINELVDKINVFDIVFEDRKEFYELQKELEINQSYCENVVKELTYKDYCKGPTEDTINKGEYWEFGKTIKTAEVYIKINRGLPNKSAICISFHKAKYKMTFPLKNK